MDYFSNIAKPPYSHVQEALEHVYSLWETNTHPNFSCRPPHHHHSFERCLSNATTRLEYTAPTVKSIPMCSNILSFTQSHSGIQKAKALGEYSVPPPFDTSSFSCYIRWVTVTMSPVEVKNEGPCVFGGVSSVWQIGMYLHVHVLWEALAGIRS